MVALRDTLEAEAGIPDLEAAVQVASSKRTSPEAAGTIQALVQGGWTTQQGGDVVVPAESETNEHSETSLLAKARE